MPAVFRLGSDRRQNPRGLTGLDADDFIGFRPLEVDGIHELVPSAFRCLQDRCSPFLRSILNPVAKLRRDVAQHIPADGVQVAISAKEANDAWLALEWLNRSVRAFFMQDYHHLDIWNRAMEYAVAVYRLAASLPVEEKYNLASQLRRAAC